MLLLVEDLATKFSSISELVELLCPPPTPEVTTTTIITKKVTIRSNNTTGCTTTTSMYSIPQELIYDKIIIAYLTVQPVKHDNVIVQCASSHDEQYPLYMTLIDNNNNESWWLSADQSMINGKGYEYVQYNLIGKQQQKRISNNKTQHNNDNSTTSTTTTTCPENSNDTNMTTKEQQQQDKAEEDEQDRSVCRLQKVSLKIPPLPMGPLSVGYFHLERLSYYNTSSNTTTTNNNNNNNNNNKSTGDSNSCTVWTKCTNSFRVDGSTSNWQEFVLDKPIDVNSIRFVCTCNQISLVSPFQENYPDYYNSVGFFCLRFD